MSKGSSPRRPSVSPEEFAQKFDAINWNSRVPLSEVEVKPGEGYTDVLTGKPWVFDGEEWKPLCPEA
jgi:hypothetical protein